MFKKIFVFLALMFPFSVFAYTVSITNGDNHLYTIKYKVCTEYPAPPYGGTICLKWGPDTTVQVGPASGGYVSFVVNDVGSNRAKVSLSSVTDDKGNALSADGLSSCSGIVNQYNGNPIISLFHLGNQIACKSGGFTKK